MRRQRRSAMNKASPYRTLTTNSLHLAEQKPDSAPVTSAGLGHESSCARVGGHDRRVESAFTSLLRSDTRPTRRSGIDLTRLVGGTPSSGAVMLATDGSPWNEEVIATLA